MIVTTQELFKLAYGHFAVGAYNINNMEQTLGLFQGSISSQAPFVIQISKGARDYAKVKLLEPSSAAPKSSTPTPSLPSTSTTATRPPATTASTLVFTARS